MIVQNISTNGCPQTIVIGRRGTYDTMQIAFDLSYLIESYGSGTAVLAVKRSQDESAYPAVVTQEDSTLLWTVNETDTAYVGSGECQLMWYVEGGLAKTIIYPMVVMRDILSTAEEPPDGYENWIEHLTGLGAETQQNAQAAAQSASEAEQAKDDAVAAKEAAEEAAETAQEAVTHAPIIQNGYWYIWNDGQYVDTGIRAEGQKGDKGDAGEKGDTGNGIESITKTGTSGLVDTYTVTYTDGTTTTFTVTNGAKGDKGDTGATGNGIQSITKTGTSGNVDTYTITYTNGQTTTFTVTNGAVSSVNGKTGAVNLASGDIAYDESATYQAGSVGAELQNQTRQLSDLETDKQDAPATTGTAGQVLGLDSNLHPVWVDNGGGGGAPPVIYSSSGKLVSFDNGAIDRPVSLVSTIDAVQAGSGVPNPTTNIRTITGLTGCTISHSDVDMSTPDETEILWETEAGTVYGGKIAVNADGSIVVTVNRIVVDLSILVYNYNSTYGVHTSQFSVDYYQRQHGIDDKINITWNNSLVADVIAEKYRVVVASGFNSNASVGDMAILINGVFQFKTGSESTLPSGKVVYPIITPKTYQLSDTAELRTFFGANRFWTDCGSISELDYTVDTGLKLEEVDNNAYRIKEYDLMPLFNRETGYLTKIMMAGDSLIANMIGGDIPAEFDEGVSMRPVRMNYNNVPRRLYDRISWNKPIWRRLDNPDWTLSNFTSFTHNYFDGDSPSEKYYKSTASGAYVEITVPQGYEHFALICRTKSGNGMIDVTINGSSVGQYVNPYFNKKVLTNTVVTSSVVPQYIDRGLSQIDTGFNENGGAGNPLAIYTYYNLDNSRANTIRFTAHDSTEVQIWGGFYWSGRTCAVINIGHGGHTTNDLKTHYLDELFPIDFDLCVFELPLMNNTRLAVSIFEQGLEYYKTNMEGKQVIYTSCNPFGLSIEHDCNYYADNLNPSMKDLNDAAISFMAENDQTFIDIFNYYVKIIEQRGGTLMGGQGGLWYTWDGQHGNVDGVTMWSNYLIGELKKITKSQ